MARELKVTRQTVHKALNIANAKVQESLEEIAKINKIKIQTVNPATGVLTGYSRHFKTEAIVTFSAKSGIQVWYRHEGNYQDCEQLPTCRKTLLSEAKERNIPIPEKHETILPSEFAKTLFSKITGDPQ